MTEEKKNQAEEMQFKSYVDDSNTQSMADLLANDKAIPPAKDTIVAGQISKKNETSAIISIGSKSDCEIAKEEFGAAWDDLKEGDSIDVYVIDPAGGKNDIPELSVKKAQEIQTWKRITSDMGEGSIVKGLMKHATKGGIVVDVNGIEAFLPGSQIDISMVKDVTPYIGKEFDLKILKINQDRKNIVVSRRELLEDELKGRREQILSTMTAGDLRTGKVKNITAFGAFIDLGGVDGLLHITDMSWKRVNDPHELLEVGQDIEVMILNIDRDKDRVSLGLKQKTANPWDNVADSYKVGSMVTGKVVNIMPYGAFVEIADGIEGLVHVSEMSWTKHFGKASEFVTLGQEVKALVIDVQPDNKKISLSIKQAERNPWEILAEKHPVGSKITGKVRSMTSYGAFVEIENGIDGMIHVSDMSWTRKISNPSEILKEGQEVEAVVLDINPEQTRISLSLKGTEPDPWENIEEYYKIGDHVKGKVINITKFGAFVGLGHKIDGLIHISQISKDRVEDVKDKLKIGQEVEAEVIKLDKEDRRIGLSIKKITDKDEEGSADAAAPAEQAEEAPAPVVTPSNLSSVVDNALNGLELDK